MRPITGTDILDFYASRSDILVLTTEGEFAHLDNNDINETASAYSFVTTADGSEVQILLERTTITDLDFFPDALDDDGNLIPSVAGEMADIINADGILPSRARKAIHAGERWAQADAEANRLAAARATAVAEVVAYCGGNQSAAARLLSLDQSTVNKLVRKARGKVAARDRECPTCGAPADEAGNSIPEHRPNSPCTVDYRAI